MVHTELLTLEILSYLTFKQVNKKWVKSRVTQTAFLSQLAFLVPSALIVVLRSQVRNLLRVINSFGGWSIQSFASTLIGTPCK